MYLHVADNAVCIAVVCNCILVLVNLITFQMNIIYVSRTACGGYYKVRVSIKLLMIYVLEISLYGCYLIFGHFRQFPIFRFSTLQLSREVTA